MLSPIRLSSVCRLSVTLVRPTEAVEIFGSISTALGTLTGIRYLCHPLTSTEFHGDRPREAPPPGELNTRGSKI